METMKITADDLRLRCETLKKRHGLGRAETETMLYTAYAFTTKEIARRKPCSEGTVKDHLLNLYKKLNIRGDVHSKRALLIIYFFINLPLPQIDKVIKEDTNDLFSCEKSNP